MSDPTAAAPTLSLSERRRLAVPGVERHLMGQHPVSPRDELRSLIAELDRSDDGTDATWDRYGEGGPVAALESQVAGLLGKPAAVMFPKRHHGSAVDAAGLERSAGVACSVQAARGRRIRLNNRPQLSKPA